MKLLLALACLLPWISAILAGLVVPMIGGTVFAAISKVALTWLIISPVVTCFLIVVAYHEGKFSKS